jgi:hypothetical protein
MMLSDNSIGFVPYGIAREITAGPVQVQVNFFGCRLPRKFFGGAIKKLLSVCARAQEFAAINRPKTRLTDLRLKAI